MTDEKAFCRKCGTEILVNDDYCPKCGARQFEPTPGEETVNKNEYKQKTIMSDNLVTVLIGLLLLCLCLVFAFVFGAHPDASQDQLNKVPEIVTPNASAGKNVCFWDWKGAIVSQVDSYNAPSGYNYALVTVYIKNEANNSVSTDPLYWSLIADGIKYTPDASISSDSIKHQTVDVGKGGEIETQFVYLIKGDPSEAILRYNGVPAPEMQRENHYTTQT
jgi:hypothetical protein